MWAHTHTHAQCIRLHNLVLVLETPYLSTRRNLSIFYFSFFFINRAVLLIAAFFYSPSPGCLIDTWQIKFPRGNRFGEGGHNERTRSRKTKRHKWRKSVASDDAKGDGKIFFLEPWMGRGRSEEIPIPPFLSPPPHRGKISRKCQQQIDLVQNRIILSETSIYLCAHDVHASKKIVRDDLEYIIYI